MKLVCAVLVLVAVSASSPPAEKQSHIKKFDFAKGTVQEHQLPKVRLRESGHFTTHDSLENLEADLLQLGSGVDEPTAGASTPEQPHTSPVAMQQTEPAVSGGAVVDPKVQQDYNEDPWSVYGGKTSLFCRIQYYHDTVEFSPQCELAAYEAIPAEYHNDRFNCQFFEQRGVLYFYGEKWMDCSPLSVRGKKIVFECGVQCAARDKAQPSITHESGGSTSQI